MKKSNIFSIVLYVVAGLLVIYTVWAAVSCARIISAAITGGQLTVGENLYDIVSYFMSSCTQYFIYALLLVASGVILQRKQRSYEAEIAAVAPEQNEENSREPDDSVNDKANMDQET